MCTIPWFFGEGREWTRNGLVLLVVACPCALIISTPVAYVAGLTATASRGLLIKGGAHLETMAAVNRICFDKTGTLTTGKFALLELEVLVDSLTRKQILEFLIAMEEQASHPVAQAIVMAAKNEGVSKILKGEGVEGFVNGKMVHVGNERLFHRLGLQVPEQNTASGFMSIEGYGLVCSFTAADAVRPEAAEVIASLKALGVESIMLTGDNEGAALSVGKMVGLASDKVKSKLLPEDKYGLVKEMVDDPANRSCFKNRRLMMIGDGVNDAPALAIGKCKHHTPAHFLSIVIIDCIS
jgi:Zn2+/Cd2+-exporting ATPase